MSTENTPSNARPPWAAYIPPSPHKLKITAPADLPDTGKNALPALGGPPLKNEYSEAPYSHAVASFADALTKQ
jgi:hypothetical protein